MLNINPTPQDKLNLWRALVEYINETGRMPSIVAVGTKDGVYAAKPEAAIKDMLAYIDQCTELIGYQTDEIAELLANR